METTSKPKELKIEKKNVVKSVNKMEAYFKNISLLNLFWKWKWLFAIVILGAAILAAVFSGPAFITPKYKSTAVVYPSNVAPYSDESETEQLIQWFNSRDIKDSIIDRFDLYRVYDIDKKDPHHYTYVMAIYNKHISISKTQFESVEIEVLDKDPVQARDMVLAIIDEVNEKIKAMQQSKYQEVLDIFTVMKQKKDQQLDSLRREMHILNSEYGLVDIPSQAREVTEGYLGTLDGDRTAAQVNMTGVKALKKSLEEKGGEYLVYTTYLDHFMGQYSRLQEEYEFAYRNVKKDFTFTNMVTSPYVADKKDYPVRWLIVLYSVIISFVVSLLIVSGVEHRDKFRLNA